MADKKISQLPKINLISGSEVILPIVHDGTTQKMDVSTFAVFTSQWSATTGSNTFIGNQTITGNTSIGGNLTVAGKLTAQELFTEITSASIIFESGSTIFGNSGDDTHQFSGSISINGKIVGNAPLDFTSQSLNTQTGSQDLVNRGISSVTGSINTTTSSFNSVFLGISSVTGAINTTTSSFDSVFLGISSFTGSLNSLTGSYATTGSNTFRGNQSITGSLSVSAGEFNVTTGSGNMTSSLIFDHTQNDGVTLGLRHNDRLSLADHTFNVQVWAGGVYTSFVRNGTPYSILNVEAFDDNKIYLYRDTRLYNKSLVVDNYLTVQKGLVIGSGSLLVNGVITGSILATNGVISSSNQLFELNGQTGSQSNLNAQIGISTSSLNFTTASLNLFTASVVGQTNTIAAFTSSVNFTTQSLNTQTGSQNSLNTSLGLITSSIYGEITSFNGVFQRVSSTTGSINTTTSSFNSVFSQIGSTTSSLIGITNGLMAFTAALDSTYATDAQLYQLYQATASIHSATASLNTQTGSQSNLNAQIGIATSSLNSVSASLIGITNGLMAFTAALDSTYATDAQLYQLYQATASIHFATQSLNTQTGSQDSVNFNISIVTSSIDAHILKQATQTGSQDLVNLGISTFTGSLRTEVNLIEAYTASLKAAAIVSSSQQITNYYKFAETASANTFYGNQNINGELNASIVRSNSHYIVSDGSAAAVVFQGYINNYLRIAESGSASSGGARGGLYVGAIDVGGTTAFAENLVMASGKGIDFSATSNGSGTTSSELLNDYEEGTWTPTVTFVGTPGTVNYVARTGRYTKIGRIVHLEYSITACSITGSAGYIVITGIPFTINASTAGYQSFAPYGATTFPSSSVLYQQGGTGDTKIYPQSITNSGFYGDMTNTNINSGGSFSVAATYTYST